MIRCICSLAENTKVAVEVSLMGMLTIFVALALLWGAIELFRYAYQASQKKSVKDESEEREIQSPAQTVTVTQPVETVQTVEPRADEGEIVAAITAALVAYLDVPQSSFRVVSFKKAGSGAHWNK